MFYRVSKTYAGRQANFDIKLYRGSGRKFKTNLGCAMVEAASNFSNREWTAAASAAKKLQKKNTHTIESCLNYVYELALSLACRWLLAFLFGRIFLPRIFCSSYWFCDNRHASPCCRHPGCGIRCEQWKEKKSCQIHWEYNRFRVCFHRSLPHSACCHRSHMN